MHPAPLVAFALRRGLMALDPVLDFARSAPPWEVGSFAWELAASLDDDALAAFDRVVRPRNLGLAVQRAWLARGRPDLALGDPPSIAFGLWDEALPRVEGAERARWIELAAARLEALLASERERTSTRIEAAKHALRFLPGARRAAVLAALDAAFEAESARGAYAQHELDPALELARAHASVGSLDRAEALLAAREARWGQLQCALEVDEIARLLADVPAPDRPRFCPVLERFVDATVWAGEQEGLCRAEWLLATADVAGPVDEALGAIVARATMAEATAEIARSATLSGALRRAADEKLASLAAGYVETLRDVTRTGKVTDGAGHAIAVRQLRASVGALTREGTTVDGRLREAARAWSAWIATQDIGFDSLPYVTTAIAWARRYRDAIPEAIAAVAKLTQDGRPAVLGHAGWEALWSEGDAVELARRTIGAA
jgi:hypothetical protein